ncbi:MAG TPA: ribonuclease R [Bacteroidia bacterium]|nr:ribonuclease R [Bacteroidia bacterium]
MKKKNHDPKELHQALLRIFRKHPTRNLNYKQVLKLVDQHDPEIAEAFLYKDDRDKNRKIVLAVMDDLKAAEDIEEVDRGRYRYIPDEIFVEGVIEITTKGTAFVMNENFDEDIFIAPRNTLNALNGDTVKIQLFAVREGKRKEGEVVEVLQRSKSEFAGTLQVLPKYAFLVPDSNRMPADIFIPGSKLNGAAHGQKVVVKITDWPVDAKNPQGEVVEILGDPGDNNTEMNAILVEYGFPIRFPDDVEADAEKIGLSIPAAEIKRRRDFRKTTTFTIDPVDAKDFDDALSVKNNDDGTWEIGVHIADVSYYLKQGSIMDEEAYDRATSVYLVDRVIPMLPEKLSNNVCSLRPKEDKLCYSAVFKIKDDGTVTDEWFGRTVIHSDRRFTYEEAQEVLETGSGDLKEELFLMHRIAKILRENRFKKGAISFEKSEIKFRLDDKGYPVGVYTKENKDSNKLIEEFMLLANRKVAEFIGRKISADNKKLFPKPPVFVYRIHDSPVPEKLQNFRLFAGKFGYTIDTKSDKEIAHSLNRLMHEVRGKKEQNVLEQLAIRTMAKAVYTTENIGHYGLAFDYYTHFTSPIRRYPDVLVHRLLDLYMHGGKSVDEKPYEEMCQHSTDMEIKASEAERASIKYKQVQYLEDKKGIVFDGIISGVTEWGFYVELVENKCEGLVRLRDIGNDYYEFDEQNYCIIGHRSGVLFRLGDGVKVEIKNTDLSKKQIDFLLAGQTEVNPRKPVKTPGDFKKKKKKGKR